MPKQGPIFRPGFVVKKMNFKELKTWLGFVLEIVLSARAICSNCGFC